MFRIIHTAGDVSVTYEADTIDDIVALVKAYCADDNGWIEWGGGHSPVGFYTDVEVRFRDGSSANGIASRWNWLHTQTSWDVVAYRVVK